MALARAIGARLARGRAIQVGALAVVAASLVVLDPTRFPPLATTLVFAALALNVATTVALQAGLGLERTLAWSLRFPLHNAVLVAAVLVLHPVAGATGATAAILVAAAVTAGLGIVVAAPIVSASVPTVPVPEGAMRFGAHQAAGAALVQAAQRGGVLLVALLAGSAAETGFAALAIGIALGATYAVLQAFTVALPHLSTTDAPGTEEAEALLRRLAGWLLAVLTPALAVGAVLLDSLVPALFGDDYRDAIDAFGPALALVALAPAAALAIQASALRLRGPAVLVVGFASAGAFVAVGVAAVPPWGAAGGTLAALAGGVAGVLAAPALLPGALGSRLLSASLAAAGLVLSVAAVT